MKQRKMISTQQINCILRKYRIRIGEYALQKDGSLDVKGNVRICGTRLFKLPLIFNTVTGDFNCKSNKLRTLLGCPKFVGGSFNCSDNELASLKAGPAYVGGDYYCCENNLNSLKGCPLEIIGSFNCAVNNLENLLYGPMRVGANYIAHHNRLATLSGSPYYVGRSFNVSANVLANLEDCPDFIGQNIHFDCWIPSLYMGRKNCIVQAVKIEKLQSINNRVVSLPQIVLGNQKYLPILFKYNKYLEIFNENETVNYEEFKEMILEIKEGLL